MTRLLTVSAFALLGVMLLFTSGVSANDGTVDPLGIEAQLLLFAPVVVFAASLLIGPDAAESLKRVIPGLVTLIVSVVYYFAQNMPDVTTELVASIGLLGAVSNRVYEWLNAATKLAFGRSINQLTGPGVLGGLTVEAD
jgi:hypothetical protein